MRLRTPSSVNPGSFAIYFHIICYLKGTAPTYLIFTICLGRTSWLTLVSVQPAAKTTTAKKDISTSTAKKTTSTPTRGHTQPAARQLESAPGMAPPSVYNMTHVPQTWPPHYYASGPRQYSSTGHIPHTLSPMQQQPTPFPLHYQSPNSRRFQLRIDTYRNPVPTGHYTFSPTSTIQPGYRRQVNTSPTSPIRPEYHNPYNTGAISPIQPGHHSPYNANATSPNQSGHLPFGHAQVRQTLSHHISPPGRAPAIDPRGTAMSPTFHRNHARSGSVQGSNGRPRNAHSHLRSSRAGRGQRQTRQ